MVHPRRERPRAAEITRGVWIHRHAIRDETALAQLPSTLHNGERHAIILAQELGATLLIDEQRGRTIAQQRGLTVIGSLWVLATAKQHNDIEYVKPLVMRMLPAGYSLDEALVELFLRSVGEHSG